MLLHRAPAEARIPTAELERRCELFRRGEWPCLLAAAEAALRTPEADSLRASRTEVEARAARATALVHLGELSAAARALVSQPLAPGSSDTLQELRDPANRPQAPYKRPSRPYAPRVQAGGTVRAPLASVPRIPAHREKRLGGWTLRHH